jgi:hypothetical protein
MIEVEHAAETLTANNAAAHGGVVARGEDEQVVETLVIALGVIVFNVFMNDLPQVASCASQGSR